MIFSISYILFNSQGPGFCLKHVDAVSTCLLFKHNESVVSLGPIISNLILKALKQIESPNIDTPNHTFEALILTTNFNYEINIPILNINP